ncbi:HNH endonuclease [Cognatishimia maritima]|uniref:HNH endonuclease n=1 Tax=Cognatishimia maritima TaxID=870908 RepID=A0A1M5MN63_9RHOB|nr:HNH endonuclease [Cognatishimia maritima]SHG78830.1 HNH endonuclease [Cognatishimia maritima]
MTEKHRYIPLPVRTQLRQEAFFGCAKCGNPILDYHHIVPWQEEHHNRPEDMIALCPTCHRIVAKWHRDRQYELKSAPENKGKGKLRGELGTDREKSSFVLGSNTFINTPNIVSYYGQSIISYSVRDNQSLISVYLPRDDFWPELKIVNNDVLVHTQGLWDVEFRADYLKIRKRHGENFFTIDLSGEHAKVTGNIVIGGERFVFSESSTNVGGLAMSGCTIKNCGGGIDYGASNMLVQFPNYLMKNPRVGWVNG